jgi:hypothetical protein
MTADWEFVAEQLTTFTRRLLDATSVEDVLRQVIDAASLLVPGVDAASVTLRDEQGQYHTPVASHPIVEKLDHVQYDAGEGPCVECARLEGPGWAISHDLEHEQRWPLFGPVAAQHGVRAVLASTIPAREPGHPELAGALNLYSFQRNGLSENDRDVVLLLASHASLALAHTKAVTAVDLERRQLHDAITSRDVIGQAKGILMERRGITAKEAFDLLRRTSQHLNVKLVELATTLINDRQGDGGAPGAG